jgi:hypothetical protein
MLSPVNRVVHLEFKIELAELSINALLDWYWEHRAEVLEQLMAELIGDAQRQWLAQVREGGAEMVCTACGLVQGRQGWTIRGQRLRRLKTLVGEVSFPLVQVTCGACGRTRAPGAEALGLSPGARIAPQLEQRALERVYETSYRRSAQALQACAGVRISASTLHRLVQGKGAQLELRADPRAEVILADGTKVRAGERTELEELRMAVQVLGREEVGGRPRARLRLLGLEVGPGLWPRVMQAARGTTVVVTDGEPALRAQVRDRYPGARHQQCEWHVGHSLTWSLRADGMKLAERRRRRAELGRILWGGAPIEERRRRYDAFTEALWQNPTSQKQLRQARGYLLFDSASTERTTSLIERQMREVDRRAWNGARWSSRGLSHLLRLSFARTHNPDDYERLWNKQPRASASPMSTN